MQRTAGLIRRVIARNGCVSVERAPRPEAPANGYLVRAEWSLISPGTELGLIAGSANGPERPLGYSLVGRVVMAGPEAPALPPGKLVACAGHEWAGHADLAAIPPLMLTPVPSGVDPQAATFTTLGAVAIQALRQGCVALGERVVVIGLGVLGQLLAQVARAAGAQVAGMDLIEARRAMAHRLGGLDLTLCGDEADLLAVVREWSTGMGADCVFLCTSGGDNVVDLACQMARDRGRLVVVGTPPLHVPRDPFFSKELQMTIARAYGPGRYDHTYEVRGIDYPPGYVRWTQERNRAEFLRLLVRGLVQVAPLITDVFAIDDAPVAYAALRGQLGRTLAVLFRYGPQDQLDGTKE